MAADFRSRYNLSIFDAGLTYSYKEAIYLTFQLLKDTSTWLFAVTNNWKYPLSRDNLIAIDNWELLQMVNSSKKSKFQPYPRPYLTKEAAKKTWLDGKAGNTKNIDPSKVKDFLTRLGHKPQGE